jgi:choloylglycine hydrolase
MCTSFTLGNKDNGYVYGRTMEFTLDLRSEVMVIPAGTQLTGADKNGVIGQGGLTWEAKYAAVAANALGLPIAIDGVNEKGLVVGVLNFPASAEYMEVSDADQSKSISSVDLSGYLLTTCATVEDAKQALAEVPVQGVALAEYGGNIPPVHYCVHDAEGGSIVVEYVRGHLHVHDNPTTVMTNEPPFHIQLENLSQYQSISNTEPDPIEVNGVKFAAHSSGDGTLGLPSGFLATSRFVRAFWFRQFAVEHKTPEEGVQTARHILNQFDIPPGTVMTEAGGTGEGGGVAGAEITQWMTVIDQKNAVLYASTYDHPNLFKVDVKKASAAANGVCFIPLPSMDDIPELLPA